jgi:predicted DNA-binding transcriptional regulator YafY
MPAMQIMKYIARLKRLDQMIRIKATGTPKELAQKLEISERSVYHYIELLREFDAPVEYCPHRRTYYYSEEGKFGFEMGFTKLEDDSYEVSGGYASSKSVSPFETNSWFGLFSQSKFY